LYQRVSGDAATVRLSSLSFEIICILQEVVEISFRTQSSPHSENMRRQYQRVQFHIISGTVPEVPYIGQQVVHLV
jgi:hypothetical protein